MSNGVLGLHHVTAISSDPDKTINFYTQLLGLRLVKLTVNFDDPRTYHLYFGDEQGHPGTILTFFPWPGQPTGRRGTGQLTTTSFSIPHESFAYWKDRLASNKTTIGESGERFGDLFLSFSDFDGQGLELVACEELEERTGWSKGPVPPEHAIRGFHSVTLSEGSLEQTESVLVDSLGYHLFAENGNRFRYVVGEGAGNIVDIMSQPKVQRGFVSVGTVHHVAFRAKDDDEQKSLRQEILETNLHVTPVIDRRYFHSIYFREPGGVLLEVATDPPGFTVDEPAETLGTRLMLPSWLESARAEIEKNLPPVHPSTVEA